ncbi:hypothetical protein N9H93_03910 [Rhizobiaceae bacterium]|nr:hypothetical protein [Rhizobiaceae bacterium]
MNADTELRDALGRGDGVAAAEIYHLEAKRLLAAGDKEAGFYLLTQAYVYALESGSSAAEGLAQTLRQSGRAL